MNDIFKKERLKKMKIILIVALLLILIPTGTYITITTINKGKKEDNNHNDDNTINTPTYSDDEVIDFNNLDINDVLSGTWYSCQEDFCYGFTYDKENNFTILGEVLSDGLFSGSIKETKKLSEYRYELLIHHPKVECSDFGKISADECEMLCSELLCTEEYRTYQVDIRDLGQKRIYIKVVGIDGYFDRFTSFDNSYGINIPYDDNHDVINRFKNNMKYLDE
ncbi:MAG: hypothetical protein PUA90_02995 [bacterium]|nr:hypothetical protein [bacterium]